MNRGQIEQNIVGVTSDYLRMLDEMVLSTTSESFGDNEACSYVYLKLEEISKRWIADETPIWGLMTSFFVGLFSVGAPFSFVLKSDNSCISFYVGSTIDRIEVMSKLLVGIFPQLMYQKAEGFGDKIYTFNQIYDNNRCVYGGFLKGNPTGNNSYKNVYQIDSVIKGMSNKSWILSLFAQPVDKTDTMRRQQLWMAKATGCSVYNELNYSGSDGVETTSYKQRYFHSEQLNNKITSFCERILESISCGEWCTTINFVSDSKDNTRLLGGLLTSAFYGERSEPEPVHTIYINNPISNPMANGLKYMHSSYCELSYPKFSTMLSSRELAVYSAFPTIDTYGLSVSDYVEFDVNRDSNGDLEIGNIIDSSEITDNTYRIDSNELNRHCLVVGLTGSGKTNTIKSLIYGLTKGTKKPFLVIEPAKKEYWELYKLGYTDLQIYSVGSSDQNAHRFCINPFERAVFIDESGKRNMVPIQTHIDFVYAAFKASFIMYTPMPYVLERSIYEIYEDCGWDIQGNTNKYGDDVYPTIEDLYFKISEVVTDMGYDSKMRNDLIGSLQARVNSMRIGTKGNTLNVYHSFPLKHLLNGNVVIELEDIGDDDVKAFIISVLLINLLEYRRQQEDCQQEVRHLMLIEEAHRLLKNVQSGTGENADPRGAAVEFFCNLLAELRSKGQGFIIADQIPSKLAPDLIKNTNVKIVHRTVAEEERMLIGGSMHMTEEQIDSLASLKQGVAAVYSEGDNRPKLVKPVFAGSFELSDKTRLSRSEVLRETTGNCIDIKNKPEYETLTNKRSPICRACKCFCTTKPECIVQSIKATFGRLAAMLDPTLIKSCKISAIENALENFINSEMPLVLPEERRYVKNCLLNCLIEHWELEKKNKPLKDRIEQTYIKSCINERGNDSV